MVVGGGGEARAGGDRRQALIESAFWRIAEKGFEGLRLREVAAEAGIDHSTLHHYFPKKEDLVAGVVEYATRQFWWTAPAGGDPGEKLRAHLAALGRMVRERPELFVVMGELDLRASRDEAVRSIVERHEQGWRVVLTEVLEEGTWAEGLDVHAGVELIIAAVKGVRLIPDEAKAVLGQLESLLTRRSAEDRIRAREGGA